MDEQTKLQPAGALAPYSSPDLPLGLRVMLDPQALRSLQSVAESMSRAQGVVPQHLIGKPAACVMVLTRAATWRLDPWAVAMATYETPGGQIGFEGKLIQAIIEASGRLQGGVQYDWFGEWDSVIGKFQMSTSDKGRKFARATYTEADEEGLGITVSARLRGETKDRSLTMLLRQAWPRNSTLWATDPKTQLAYAAVRRFASVCVPSLVMGVPWADLDDTPAAAPGVTIEAEPDEPEPKRRTGPSKARQRAAEKAAAISEQANEPETVVEPAAPLPEPVADKPNVSEPPWAEAFRQLEAQLLDCLDMNDKGAAGRVLAQAEQALPEGAFARLRALVPA